MNIVFKTQRVFEPKRGAVPIFIVRGKAPNPRQALFTALAKEDQNHISLVAGDLLRSNDGDSRLVVLPSGGRAILLGFSADKPFRARDALRLVRRAINMAKATNTPKIAVALADFIVAKMTPAVAAESFALQATLANFDFISYKQPPKTGWHWVKEVTIIDPRAKMLEPAIGRGRIIGEETNNARTLANTPGGDMTPALLAAAAESAGKRTGFAVTILDETEMKKIGMGAVLGVGRGSDEKPKFIVMEYRKGKKSEMPIVLVGKGVTFDTGGLNLKPSEHIYEMHMDMSGGAAVIHALAAAARLKLKKNIIGLVPAVENMPSGSSYHPGDLLKTLSGKTIEVLNTDAEGRIILADALTYAERYKPRLVIDVATLTGAATVALGQRASAIFATDKRTETALMASGERTGDYLWPLPLWEEYEEDVKGTFGDWANSGKTRYGGAINGAVFLWQFAKSYPWVHLDIAPRMTSIDGDFLAKGATGVGVPLLADFLARSR